MHTRNKNRIVIIILVIIAVLFITAAVYRQSMINLLDTSRYGDLITSIEKDSADFESQEDLLKYITDWADDQGIKYERDSSDNIIFRHKAIKSKKNVTPTVILVDCNYQTVFDDRRVLSSAAMIAGSDIRSGQYTVIFVNNKNNDGEAYMNLDTALFPDSAKVIYLDYGKGAYVSTDSFLRRTQHIIVPSEKEEISCDTAIKLHIGGIPSDLIGPSVSGHINPIELFSTVLTRLKTKSIVCQLADVKVKGAGEMYPVSIDATFLVNSYNVPSLTSFLDDKIKAFDKATKDEEKYPDAEYSYEVVDKVEDLGDEVYSSETIDSLTTVLYTVKNGLYRFTEDEVVPEGYDEGDIYAINCVRDISTDENGDLFVAVSTQALDGSYCDSIVKENSTAAELSLCRLEVVDAHHAYTSIKTALPTALKRTYYKVCNLTGGNIQLDQKKDTYFTPMTYLHALNDNMDIVHVKESSDTAKVITNMLLCYIKTSGNFMSL